MEVEENFVIQSIGAEHTFERDTGNWSAIDKQLIALTHSVHSRLAEAKMTYRTVVLKIRFKGFETYTRTKSLRFSTMKEGTIIEIISELCAEFKSNPKEVRLIGVRLSGLESKPTSTIDTFISRN